MFILCVLVNCQSIFFFSFVLFDLKGLKLESNGREVSYFTVGGCQVPTKPLLGTCVLWFYVSCALNKTRK